MEKSRRGDGEEEGKEGEEMGTSRRSDGEK